MPHLTDIKQPYKTKHGFTCQAQTDDFKSLLRNMAEKPQDYISFRGRTTTNTVEGFHGLALMYRSKRTDLGHTHYVCKTNMAVCHKVSYASTGLYTLLTPHCDRTSDQSGRYSSDENGHADTSISYPIHPQ